MFLSLSDSAQSRFATAETLGSSHYYSKHEPKSIPGTVSG